ncbi:hypothetical protein [Pseudomonas sp. Irchel s3a12]|uniref:hypothetical protein n=1 Tax=Pseudomonas sp. Irchel s3a12 TaxID=2009047 RepID=UPI000BA3619D|nr:hypothetical protein [Pseudomonas sp. Irchel s3a12]
MLNSIDSHQPLGRELRHYPGFLFFIPITTLFKLVYGQTALENSYEQSARRDPAWPSWKSLDAWVFSPNACPPCRPTSVASIDALIQRAPVADLLDGQDTIWQSELEWKGFLSGEVFKDQRSIDYWTTWLVEDKKLGCEVLPARTSIEEKIRAIACSTLTLKLGCAGSAARMSAYEWNNDPQQLNTPIFEHNRIADFFAVIVRVSAWVVAEISVREWENLVAAKLENEILLKSVIPRFDEHDKNWTRPIAEQLRSLAVDAGFHGNGRASAFLGEILAKRYMDISDKQRTLRRWEELHPGKPRDSVLEGLLESVRHLLNKHGGLWSSVSAHNRKFRFAWLNAVLLREMMQKDLPWWHIREVFDAFEEEFRKARALLGRPLS